MDGTLMDSEAMYHKGVREMCEKYGKKYTISLQWQLLGATDRQICERVVQEAKLPISAAACEAQLKDLLRHTLPNAPLKKGAERLLKHLRDHNILTALATNSTEHTVLLNIAARPKFFAMFHHKVCVTDPEVEHGKPYPDIYLVAASRFPDKPKPKDCLVFEDTIIGVQAARAAGMQVVLIPDHEIERKKTRQATLVLSSLMLFRPELFGLPPFDEYTDTHSRKFKY